MLEYIKMIILSVFTAVMKPLPVSSAAHYSFLNKVLSFSENETQLTFYYYIFTLVFSLSVFIMLRKIYIKSVKALFVKDKAVIKKEKLVVYKKVGKNVIICILPSVLLFIPVSKESLLIDYFGKFLTENAFFLTTFATIVNALIMVISIWYSRQNFAEKKRVPETKSIVRMAVYSLLSYVVPGFSQISCASTNMVISDTDERVVMRDIYLYLAPQAFVVSLVQIIRVLVADFVFDPIMLIIAVVFSALIGFLIIKIVGKFNMRKLFAYFTIYSAVFGVVIGITAFLA